MCSSFFLESHPHQQLDSATSTRDTNFDCVNIARHMKEEKKPTKKPKLLLGTLETNGMEYKWWSKGWHALFPTQTYLYEWEHRFWTEEGCSAVHMHIELPDPHYYHLQVPAGAT